MESRGRREIEDAKVSLIDASEQTAAVAAVGACSRRR